MCSLVGRSGNNMDDEQNYVRVMARQPFIMINEYLQAQRNRNTESPSVTTIMEASGREVSQAAEQHLISGFVRRKNGYEWQVESTWESEEIRLLDEIRLAGEYEWHPLNYRGGENAVKSAMVRNVNVVLFRNIMDWSRPDGEVWSQQIAWSGNFENCQRILQLIEENSDSATNPLKLIRETFNLHPELRNQYITRHRIHPLIATIVAVEPTETICISEELTGTGDGENDRLLCAVCHEVFSIGEPAKKLRCNHIFHTRCIFQWFLRQLSCPLCRDDLK